MAEMRYYVPMVATSRSVWHRLLTLVLIGVLLQILPGMARLESFSEDWRFRHREVRPPPPEIVLVAIDETTLSWAQRPGFLMSPLIAEAIEGLRACKKIT